jgi:hypothetical protein
MKKILTKILKKTRIKNHRFFPVLLAMNLNNKHNRNKINLLVSSNIVNK